MWLLCSKSYLWEINCNTKCYNQIKNVYCIHKILIIIALALFLFSAEKEKQKNEVKSEFKCEGKKYCKEMSSCKEAMFYLKQCGVSRLDRDKDGIPCETICR